MQPPPYISSTSTGSLAGLMVPQRHSVVISCYYTLLWRHWPRLCMPLHGLLGLLPSPGEQPAAGLLLSR